MNKMDNYIIFKNYDFHVLRDFRNFTLEKIWRKFNDLNVELYYIKKLRFSYFKRFSRDFSFKQTKASRLKNLSKLKQDKKSKIMKNMKIILLAIGMWETVQP